MDKNLGKFVIGTQFFLLIGLLVLVPTLIEIGIESGFPKALLDIITMQKLSDEFFHFSLVMKAHYFGIQSCMVGQSIDQQGMVL